MSVSALCEQNLARHVTKTKRRSNSASCSPPDDRPFLTCLQGPIRLYRVRRGPPDRAHVRGSPRASRATLAGSGRSQSTLIRSSASERMAEQRRWITRRNNSAAVGNACVRNLRPITHHRLRAARPIDSQRDGPCWSIVARSRALEFAAMRNENLTVFSYRNNEWNESP
jgi:hypothetical protein